MAVVAPLGAQSITFDLPPSYAAGNGPIAMGVGSFNPFADMRADLVVVNSGSNNVSVYLNDGAGGFGAATNYAVGSNPVAIAVSNINADSFADLAVANRGSDNVSILLGDGVGGFTAATTVGAGSSPNGVALADFNGDGSIDVAAANSSSGNVSIRFGNGIGGFGAATFFSTGTNPRHLVAGLFNADALQDVATVSSDQVSVLLGTPGGGLAAPTNIPIPLLGGESIAIGSFGADANLDLVVAGRIANSVAVLLGNGSGGFSAAVLYPAGAAPRSVAVVDFDASGTADLVVAAEGDQALVTLSGNGNGTFGAPVKYGTGGRAPQGVIAGFFDVNVNPDVAVANTGSNMVSVHLGQGAGRLDGIPIHTVGLVPRAVAAANLDGDADQDLVTANVSSDDVSVLLNTGNGTFAPAVPFLVGDDPRSLVLADVNGGGVPDVVVVNQIPGTVTVRLGMGNGAFSGPVTTPAGTSARGLAVVDVDNDGARDVLTLTGNSNLSVMTGNGDGTFDAATNYAMGTNPLSLAAGLFDAGSTVDVVSANSNSVNASVRLGAGGGTFGPVTNVAVGSLPQFVVTGLFNADAFPDVAVCHGLSDNVAILLNNGSGGFGAATFYPITFGSFCSSLAVVDLNGDGSQDIAATDIQSQRLTILAGNGAGAFAAPVHFNVANATSVAAAHLDGDARPDLAVSNGNNGNVWLFFNTSVPPVADLSITKTDGETTAIPGISVGYTITVTNLGPSTVTSLNVVDTLPPTLLTPAFIPQSGQYSSVTGNWTGLNLGVNQTATLLLSGAVHASATGTLTNTVTVTPPAGTTDPVPGNNTATDVNTLTPYNDLAVTKTDGVIRVAPGQGLTYSVVVTNNGPSDATGATVADFFPSAVTGVTWSCAGVGGASCPAPSGTGDISQVASMPVGGSLTYTAAGTVSPSATGLLTNAAFVTAALGANDFIPGNNAAYDTDSVEGFASELVHGTSQLRSLQALPGPAARDEYFLVSQKPFSSYEVVVDATSGDIGAGQARCWSGWPTIPPRPSRRARPWVPVPAAACAGSTTRAPPSRTSCCACAARPAAPAAGPRTCTASACTTRLPPSRASTTWAASSPCSSCRTAPARSCTAGCTSGPPAAAWPPPARPSPWRRKRRSCSTPRRSPPASGGA